jgi:hypothetical protein
VATFDWNTHQLLSFDHLQAILRQHTSALPDVRKPSPNTRYTIQNAALEAVLKL